MDAPRSATDELYRAAVGARKAPYYLPLFRIFETRGCKASWNWPAAFITFFWLLYRKMYRLAFAYLMLWPVALLAAVFLSDGAAGATACLAVALGVQIIAIPLYANALYHRHVDDEIRRLSASTPSHEALVQRLASRRATAGTAVVIAVACLCSITGAGVLAAIAIPPYQDHLIRSQVATGLGLAVPVKEALTTAYLTTGTWPADLPTLGLDPGEYRGAYVDAIEVIDGSVLIHYGNAAHRLIAGGMVSLHPISVASERVQWSCGYSHAFADGQQPWTNIAPKYLPPSCQPPSDR